jgi:hypothetical protein
MPNKGDAEMKQQIKQQSQFKNTARRSLSLIRIALKDSRIKCEKHKKFKSNLGTGTELNS